MSSTNISYIPTVLNFWIKPDIYNNYWILFSFIIFVGTFYNIPYAYGTIFLRINKMCTLQFCINIHAKDRIWGLRMKFTYSTDIKSHIDDNGQAVYDLGILFNILSLERTVLVKPLDTKN